MRKNPGVAALLSFFFVGAGQIYNGQILKGVLMVIAFWVLGAISLVLTLSNWLYGGFTNWLYLLPPFFLALWFYGIFDAYKMAIKINEEMANKEGRDEVTKTSS
jgi:TM2 domain-containing membrane protein YozV